MIMDIEETHRYYAKVLQRMSDKQVQDLSSALEDERFLFTIRYSVLEEQLPITLSDIDRVSDKDRHKGRYYQLVVESEEGLAALCEEVSRTINIKPSIPNTSRSLKLKEKARNLYDRFTELFLKEPAYSN